MQISRPRSSEATDIAASAIASSTRLLLRLFLRDGLSAEFFFYYPLNANPRRVETKEWQRRN